MPALSPAIADHAPGILYIRQSTRPAFSRAALPGSSTIPVSPALDVPSTGARPVGIMTQTRLSCALSPSVVFLRRKTHASSPSRKPKPSVGHIVLPVISHTISFLCVPSVSFVVQILPSLNFSIAPCSVVAFALPITRSRAIFGFPDLVAALCRCTLSQTPTPHKRFVENKRQTPIRKACRKAVDPSFSRFFEPRITLSLPCLCQLA